MPDFHQPDEADRADAEAAGAADQGAPLEDERPSSANDPNAPDRPKT